MPILFSPLTPNQKWERSMRDKHQVIEEPDEKKFSRPVLKESSGKRFPVRLYLLKNRKLSRAISQAGWREFRAMCEAKSSKFGREFVVISRWEPTSQICSDCGYRWGKLDLSVRDVVCINCGTLHDRDDNASKNIEQVGVGHTRDSKRTGRECKTSLEATPLELSTHLEYEPL